MLVRVAVAARERLLIGRRKVMIIGKVVALWQLMLPLGYPVIHREFVGCLPNPSTCTTMKVNTENPPALAPIMPWTTSIIGTLIHARQNICAGNQIIGGGGVKLHEFTRPYTASSMWEPSQHHPQHGHSTCISSKRMKAL